MSSRQMNMMAVIPSYLYLLELPILIGFVQLFPIFLEKNKSQLP